MRLMTMRRYRTAVVLPAGLTLAGLVLAGCGPGGAAPPSASPTLTDAQIQVVVNELVQCIRTNGAPGMPDVKAENGHVILPDQTTLDEATGRNLASAAEACKSIQDRLPESVFRKPGDDEQRKPTAEDVPALREWSKCIREHGVAEWPDPKPDGSFPRDNAAIKEGKSDRIIAAWKACEQYWNGSMERT